MFTFICRGCKDSRIFSINQSGTREFVASDGRLARILFHMIGVRNPAIPTAQPPKPEVASEIAPGPVAEPATLEVAKPQENPTQPRPEPYNSPH